MDDDDTPAPDRPGNLPSSRSQLQDDDEALPDYFPGESNRTVPVSAWWVLGLAVVLLLAFILGRPLLSGPGDDVVTALDVPDTRHFASTLTGLGREDGIWLTDDTPSSSFLVSLPVDSSREHTRLRLSGTTQVPEHSTVFLRVAMDGQQVWEVELPSGENNLDEAIDVPNQAAEDGKLRVRVSTRGFLHTEVCTPERSAGAVIHLDPETVVEASLSEPIHTVRDAVAAWDRDLTVVLADQGDEWASTSADLGVALMRSGYAVTYSDQLPDGDLANTILVGPPERLIEVAGWNGEATDSSSITLGTIEDVPVLGVVEPEPRLAADFLSTSAVSVGSNAQSDPRALSVSPREDPTSLGNLGADLTQIEITETHSWNTKFSLADLPNGRLPESVRVDLQMPASPADLIWILNVSLNGRLLTSRPLGPSGSEIVPLPPSEQLVENNLTLTVQSDRDHGGCDVRPTSYPMQLLPSSGLVLSDEPGTGFTAIPGELAPGYDVYAPSGEEASMIDTLNALVPVIAVFSGPQDYPQYRWGLSPRPGAPFIVVGPNPVVIAPVHVENNRLVAGGDDSSQLDLAPFDNGAVIQCATGPDGSTGLSIQSTAGSVGTPLPTFGRECVQVSTPGGGFTLDSHGALVTAEATRASAPR
ncbi:hypothetical protein ACWGLC_02135 [Dietzia sp. NPDC055877]